jgi:hypothetical protein
MPVSVVAVAVRQEEIGADDHRHCRDPGAAAAIARRFNLGLVVAVVRRIAAGPGGIVTIVFVILVRRLTDVTAVEPSVLVAAEPVVVVAVRIVAQGIDGAGSGILIRRAEPAARVSRTEVGVSGGIDQVVMPGLPHEAQFAVQMGHRLRRRRQMIDDNVGLERLGAGSVRRCLRRASLRGGG